MAAHTKGALNLLLDYESNDSEEDCVPGPKISVKRSLSPDGREEQLHKKLSIEKKLPLPAIIGSLYPKQDKDIIDNPADHEGRVRSFCHERGNWATYIYIPCYATLELQSLVDEFIKILHSCAAFEPVDDLHISLSKTVVLRHHWIDSFVDTLLKKVKEISRFQVGFGSVQVYNNEENTRTFVGLSVFVGTEFLLESVRIVNQSLSDFNLPQFYEDPSFHISVAWCLGDKKSEILKFLPELETIFQQFYNENPERWKIEVESFYCKSGNKMFSLYLSDK